MKVQLDWVMNREGISLQMTDKREVLAARSQNFTGAFEHVVLYTSTSSA